MRKIFCGFLLALLLMNGAALATETGAEPAAATETTAATEAQATVGAIEKGCTPPTLYEDAACVLTEDTVIAAQWVKDEAYLFLPSGADRSKLVLRLTDGVTATCGDTTVQSGVPFDAQAADSVTVTDAAGKATQLHLMQSATLRTLCFVSDEPETQGRAYVEENGKHSTRAAGTAMILSAEGAVDFAGKVKQLRGRGNTTWYWGEKKPYQLKLAEKADLLNTGDDDNRDKTWLLLADAFDPTSLHNTLSYAIGRELGLVGPECEPIDFYYDGEYRGTYLLCEKTEIAAGRLNLLDYDKAIDKQYPQAAELPTALAQNRDGCEFQYVEGVEADSGVECSALIEIDQYFYQGSTTWFSTQSGLHFTVKTPEYGSKADVAYLSELVQRVENALLNGGVDPNSDAKLADLLDYESMARFWLLSEFTKNPDYWYGSTFFYKKEGEEKLYCGPIWDFDIAYAMRNGRENEDGAENYLRNGGWIGKLTALPDFQEVVTRIWREELQPLIANVVLGDESAQSGELRSAAWYAARIASSQAMNSKLWSYGGGYNNMNWKVVFETYQENYDYLVGYVTDRLAWMTDDLAQWSGAVITDAALTLRYRNANILECAALTANNVHSGVSVGEVQWTSEKLADEPYHTLYTATTTLTAEGGRTFAEDAALTVNGYAPELLERTETTRTIRYAFVGPTFEEAVYDDVDYGLIYQYDYFVLMNPDVVEECGDDEPETMLAYFVDYGLYDELTACETYDSQTFIGNYEKMLDAYYMLDPYSCAMHYLENCYAEDLLAMEEPVLPTPSNVTAQNAD